MCGVCDIRRRKARRGGRHSGRRAGRRRRRGPRRRGPRRRGPVRAGCWRRRCPTATRHSTPRTGERPVCVPRLRMAWWHYLRLRSGGWVVVVKASCGVLPSSSCHREAHLPDFRREVPRAEPGALVRSVSRSLEPTRTHGLRPWPRRPLLQFGGRSRVARSAGSIHGSGAVITSTERGREGFEGQVSIFLALRERI